MTLATTQHDASKVDRAHAGLFRVRSAFSALLLFAVAPLMGCGGEDGIKVYPVTGQITYQGKPLANALVVLHPKDTTNEKIIAARGQTDASGTFHATTFETSDGAAAGEYAVTVQYYPLTSNGNGSFEPGPNALPSRLASPQTTDVVIRVAESPNTLPPLEVSR